MALHSGWTYEEWEERVLESLWYYHGIEDAETFLSRMWDWDSRKLVEALQLLYNEYEAGHGGSDPRATAQYLVELDTERVEEIARDLG
jgi:hypothetical protein